MAGELAAGSPPNSAVMRVGAEHHALLAHSVAAARCGGDVAAALDRDGRRGALILRDAAVAWRVGATTGTGLCAALRTLVRAARDAEDVRTALEGQLAAPRATARTMALLPVIGLGLGALLGADPFDWLLGSVPGLLCLAAAVAFTVLGVAWMNRIASRVEAAL